MGHPSLALPTTRDGELILTAQEGTPQEQFLASSADIGIFGGGSGGGKTIALLLEPLRHIHDPAFGAVFFRRSYPEIEMEGGPWDLSHMIYGHLGGQAVEGLHEWRFPSGARIKFSHLERDLTAYDWKGAQICLICVRRGTKVLMEDRTWKAIETIQVGEFVSTLSGPRRVQRVHGPWRKPVAELRVGGRSLCVIGDRHRFLTDRGWVSPASLRSTESQAGAGRHRSFQTIHSVPGGLWLSRLLDQQPVSSVGARSLLEKALLGIGAWSAVPETGFVVSDDARRETVPPRESFVSAMLHGPALHRVRSDLARGAFDARTEKAVRDLLSGYRVSPCFDGGPPRPFGEFDRGGIPSPSDAAGPNQPSSRKDGPGIVPAHSQSGYRYLHPYRNSWEEGVDPVLCHESVSIVPAGEEEVFDLTVEGVSHYVAWPGLIMANCFDQLEMFTEFQFWYLFSRNTSLCSARPYIRASCNPDPDSFVANLISWWIGSDGLPIADRSGQLRHFVRHPESDELLWADDPSQLAYPGSKSLTFVRALLIDNPAALRADPTRLATLQALPKVERERLAEGNWLVRPSAGMVFDRSWFRFVDAVPHEGVMGTVRSWDKAGTEGKGKYTVGVRMTRYESGLFVIDDIVRGQWGSLEREQIIQNTAMLDGKNVDVIEEQEPGSGGKHSSEVTIRNLVGYNVHAERPSGSKVTRALPYSAQVEAGNVKLLAAPWNKAFIDEHHAFDKKADKGEIVCDQVDACSQAFNYLAELQVIPHVAPQFVQRGSRWPT